MKRRTFLAGTTAVSVPAVTAATAMTAAPAAAAFPSAAPLSGADTAATLRLVIDGVPHDLPPTTVYRTTIEATGTAGRTRVTMAGAYSEFSVAFPSPYAPYLARVSVWLTGVTPKKGNLWLKIFDQDNEEWGTLASRVDPTGFDGRTRVTFEPQRLARMTWSGVADGKLTYPLRRLVLVFFPDDKQSADPFVFEVESVEVVGDGGPVSTWSRAGALELTSGADRVLIDDRGRLLDWTSGGRIQSPGVLPLAVYYDNGTGVFSDEAEVDVARVAADEAAVSLTVPGFLTAQLTVRLRAGRLELRPTAIRNLWSRSILSVACPEVAYRVIPADGTMLGIAPKWGGLAHTRSVLAGGFYANYGMPTATHDLILFEEDDSALGVYSVQPASARPYRPAQFGFVGGRARNEALTGLMHRVDAWIAPGGSERLPATRLVAGESAFDLFAAYRADNGMNTWRGLTDKLGPRLRAGLADSVHLKVDLWQPTGGTSATGRPEAAFEYLRAVPGGPYSVELASYYSDGQHDHHYPDFLTFDYLGGPAEFQRLIDTIHDRGHYASAYTNPTWWHPDSRAVAALGGVERIGIRDRRGKLVTKTHTNNLGYLIGGWRKAPRALILDQLRTFRDTYGMDMMFQDEIARREYDYAADFCAPPYAYCEELVEQTAQSAAILPIGTEGVGGDRIFQSLTSSLGFYLNTMQGDRASTYDGPNRNGVVVQQWPLGTAVMHDKVAFYPHNLDRGVDTTENLSWALAFGLNLHYQAQHMTADFRAGRGFELLKGLSLVQKRVAGRYFGRAMTAFRYLTEDLKVSRTAFDGGVEIVASHDLQPRALPLPGGQGTVTVAPHGFVAGEHGTPTYALIDDAHHRPGYLARWTDGRFVPELAWYPADLAGYRSDSVHADLRLTATPAELPAGGTTRAALVLAAWDGTPLDLDGADIAWELDGRPVAHLVTDADGSVWLTPEHGGATGWATVRAVVTRDGVPAYSGVALVEITA
ncbi:MULTISPECIES: hypothetical protein [unclassified Streptomyces]|uniref:hypothetical protein n=1 Tax=unclassified Streptomyces TaxID=2593676 RepID=UPI00081BC69F|nr:MULTISPECIES: hypothetical protein [unclassified Streptomyces]MYQ89665.1 hypothetical protein [Streptomyces sp. SID4936]SCE59185.1 hypothetical protein GA0115234_114775 [Streptomyces sp. DvalAA-43]